MSTIIVGKILTKLGSHDCRIVSVVSSLEKLAQYVRKKRTDKGLSTTDVENRSKQGGREGISDAYVTRIENKQIKKIPGREKLAALADGLGVSREEVFAIAYGVEANTNTITDERFEIISLKFRQVDQEKRRNAEALLEALERELERVSGE
jgi:transcriptional regulator with XRE-family HTH domain